MKAKHNKKRNTAFVYEALLKEAVATIIKKDSKESKKIVNLIRKHFGPGSLLRRDLECYRSLYENQSLDKVLGEKILKEAIIAKKMISQDDLFIQQTEFIKDINKNVSPSVFNNFVPNYKTLATINKMFNTPSPKEKVILENKIIENMSNTIQESIVQDIDNFSYKIFVNKFNERYSDELLKEQKELLGYYITSFVDNSIELKMFMNEELYRLKEVLNEALEKEEIKTDSEMKQKTLQVIERLNKFATTETKREKILITVLKTQQLVREIYKDGSNS